MMQGTTLDFDGLASAYVNGHEYRKNGLDTVHEIAFTATLKNGSTRDGRVAFVTRGEESLEVAARRAIHPVLRMFKGVAF